MSFQSLAANNETGGAQFQKRVRFELFDNQRQQQRFKLPVGVPVRSEVRFGSARLLYRLSSLS
jgi:hypothetical protein